MKLPDHSFALNLLLCIMGCIFKNIFPLFFLIHWADIITAIICLFFIWTHLAIWIFQERSKSRVWWWIYLCFLCKKSEVVQTCLPLNTTFKEGVWVCYHKIRFTYFRPLPSLSLSFTSSKTWITILTLPWGWTHWRRKYIWSLSIEIGSLKLCNKYFSTFSFLLPSKWI